MYHMLYAAAAGVLTWACTGMLVRWLVHRARMAEPTERGMHSHAIPVGGGLAIVAAISALWPLAAGPLTRYDQVVLACAVGLCCVSWIDDQRPLWPVTRLAVQAMAVSIALSAMPPDGQLLPMIPLAVEPILLGIAWVWIINLYNFMDGIDGLAGSETVAIGIGVVAIGTVATGVGHETALAFILAGAALGYLVWNWHPARIFMGDCGAIPLGFLVGWLMLVLARKGALAAAVILPLYFIADAPYQCRELCAYWPRPLVDCASDPSACAGRGSRPGVTVCAPNTKGRRRAYGDLNSRPSSSC
jgi:UDP-N-acetylmuramyl pentapeptide phosphotransferase/UDP-N-acetylglucosamine-1-phosphate transferase